MSKFANKEELKKYIEEQRILQKTSDKKKYDELWANLPKFTDINKVPDLPIVDKDLWDSFYVPKIIDAGGIPKKDLLAGHFYLGNHRRGKIGQWDAQQNRFLYWREKFSQCFIDSMEHFEDWSQYSVFVPIMEVSEKDWNLTNLNLVKEPKI